MRTKRLSARIITVQKCIVQGCSGVVGGEVSGGWKRDDRSEKREWVNVQLQLQLQVWLESIILLLYESNMRQLIISPIYNNRQSIPTVSKWFYVQQEYKKLL